MSSGRTYEATLSTKELLFKTSSDNSSGHNFEQSRSINFWLNILDALIFCSSVSFARRSMASGTQGVVYTATFWGHYLIACFITVNLIWLARGLFGQKTIDCWLIYLLPAQTLLHHTSRKGTHPREFSKTFLGHPCHQAPFSISVATQCGPLAVSFVYF